MQRNYLFSTDVVLNIGLTLSAKCEMKIIHMLLGSALSLQRPTLLLKMYQYKSLYMQKKFAIICFCKRTMLECETITRIKCLLIGFSQMTGVNS